MTIQEEWDAAVATLLALTGRIRGASGTVRKEYQDVPTLGKGAVEIKHEPISQVINVSVPLPVEEG
jgi:hypothetical protein